MNSTKDKAAELLRAYILTEAACRNHSSAYLSSPPPPDLKELSDAHRAAAAALWMGTDFEYAEDGFREIIWRWRYCKVMARKCGWMQRLGSTEEAAQMMRELRAAERAFVLMCGLTGIYRTAGFYLEEAFPNLKEKTPV